MTEKIDLKRTLPDYRAPRGGFEVVDLPVRRYLCVDGHGDPNTSQEYAAALAALYPVAYALKFASRNDLGRDYVVPPLEGLWWADDMRAFTTARDKSRWDWTMMLLVPDWIDVAMIPVAVERVGAKRAPARLDEVRVDELREGCCVQTLHVGSYDDEAELLDRLHHQFVPQHGFVLAGKHHEIYLSDARRVAPDRLRTVLRQPVKTASPVGPS